MNRSILIVICDFLLVSLLVFSSVDINKVSEEGRTQPIKVTVATNQADAGTDLAVGVLARSDWKAPSSDWTAPSNDWRVPRSNCNPPSNGCKPPNSSEPVLNNSLPPHRPTLKP